VKLKHGIALVVLGGIIVAAGVGLKLWRGATAPEKLEAAVKAELARACRGALSMESISLSPAWRLEAEGLELRGPEQALPIFTCERAAAEFGPWEFLAGSRVPRRVVLSRPRLELIQDANTGRWNLTDLLPERRPKAAAPRPALFLSHGLAIDDALVRIQSARVFADELPRVIPGVNLTAFPGPSEPGAWTLSGTISAGPLRGTRLSGWSRGGEDAGFRVEFVTQGLEVGPELLAQVPLGGRIEELFHPAGRVGGSLVLGSGPDGGALRYSARLEVESARCLTRYFPVPLEDVAGTLEIGRNRVVFHGMTASARASSFGLPSDDALPASIRMDGVYQMRPEWIGLSVEALDVPLCRRSVEAIPGSGPGLWEDLRPGGGTVDVSVRLNAPGTGPGGQWAATVRLKAADLAPVWLPVPLEEIEGVVEVTPEEIRFCDVRGLVPQEGRPAHVNLSGRMDPAAQQVELKVELHGLRAARKLVQWLPGFGEELWESVRPEAVLDGVVLLRGPLAEGTPEVTGALQVSGGRAVLTWFPVPVDGIAGTVSFDPARVRVGRLSGRLVVEGSRADAVDCVGSVTVRGETELTGQQSTFEFHVSDVELSREMVELIPGVGPQLWEELQPQGMVAVSGKVRHRPGADPDLSYFVEAQLKNARALWRSVPVSLGSLSGHVLVTNDAVVVSSVDGMAATGWFRVSGVAELEPDGASAFYRGTVEFRRADLRRLLGELTQTESDMRGRLSGIVEVGGRLGEQEELMGLGRLELSGASLWSAPFFMGLVDALHLSVPGTGGAFDAGEVEFELEDSRVNVQRFRLASRAVELEGSGQISLEDWALELDMVAATLPEGGLPIIGDVARMIMRPVERELVKLHVTGTLESPKFEHKVFKPLTHPITSLFDLVTSPFRRGSDGRD